MGRPAALPLSGHNSYGFCWDLLSQHRDQSRSFIPVTLRYVDSGQMDQQHGVLLSCLALSCDASGGGCQFQYVILLLPIPI